MLNLAGVDLIVDANREAEDFIRRYVPTSAYFPWRRSSWPGFGTAGISYPVTRYEEPEFRLYRLHWPCTKLSRWAFMHLLASSDQVDVLNGYACSQGLYSPVPFKMGNPETGGEILSLSMYLLPPTPLSGKRGLTGSIQSLYLITIVDLRYFLQFINTGDLTAYVTTSTTWVQLYKKLVSQMGITMQIDDIPSQYLQPSIQMFNLPYEPAPIVADAVAANVGQRITALYDGTYWAQNYQSAISAYQADIAANPNRVVLAGGFRYSVPT